LLTAIGLTPGGSSTVHIYTQTIHRTTQLIWEECGPCPVFASYTMAFALQLRVTVECQLARWNWTGYILHRDCPLQDVSEGKIKGRLEVNGRRENIGKQLLEYLKNRGYSKLKEEALTCNLWNRLVRG